jgi:alkanesulfonate monooxygenase SsuD/methylene tetrahydromethanopterin reductase-like flavin-dependent oxidoreductase (luciferase family)
MDFGAFILCQRLDEATPATSVFPQALELVKSAEAAGFNNVWFPEHHLLHYVSCPSPLMMAVKAASQTNRIRVGTAITVAPYYHPLRLAGEIALADHLTNGRLDIGIGRGAVDYEFVRFGIDAKTASARFIESTSAVMRLLKEENVSCDGPTWPFAASTSVPRPYQSPFPPMWVAARSGETMEWAVRHDMNVMTNTPWGEPFSGIQKAHAMFATALEKAKPKRRPRFGVSRVTFVADTDAQARAEMAEVQKSNRIFTRLFRNLVTVTDGFAGAAPVDGEPSQDHLFDVLIAGSPETCIAKLKQYEALGVDHFIMFVLGGTHESAMKSVRLFGEKVIPAFRRG